MSWDLVLGFFPEEMQRLILDNTISDLMINGTTGVFADRNGMVEHIPLASALTTDTLLAATQQIARKLGQNLSDQNPILNTRLHGISAYREIEREFAAGDRLAFSAPNRELGVANRDLGTIEHIGHDGQLAVRMDSGKAVTFDANEMRHFDHGYAVTSHSSQGLTAERVIVNIDTQVHPQLINPRFAYVSVSRAAHDAQIFTNDAPALSTSLSHSVTKTSALELASGPGI